MTMSGIVANAFIKASEDKNDKFGSVTVEVVKPVIPACATLKVEELGNNPEQRDSLTGEGIGRELTPT